MTPDNPPLVELVDVGKEFPSPAGGATTSVLRGVSLRVAEAESVAVVGPSGSGKSTLLNIVGILDSASSGMVLLGGRDLSALDENERAAVRANEIGFVFQEHHLLPQLNALENVLVPTVACADSGRRRGLQDRARTLLERVGLGGRLAHSPAQLSGGERQRVALVRALINRPRLLLADEPTGSLDRAASDEMAALLSDLNRRDGVAMIVVTHSVELARGLGRVLELGDGNLRPLKETG